jgi:hypothetical protein
MDNPERLATQGTQDEEKQNKNTTHTRPTRLAYRPENRRKPNNKLSNNA